MVQEAYVSFETAKLLKEKGFDEEIETIITPDGRIYYVDENSVSRVTHTKIKNSNINIYLEDCSCLTLQMAMKWLREVHNILIVVDYEWECDTTPYYFKIYRLDENGKPKQVPVKGISYDKDDNPTEHIIGYRDWERSLKDFSSHEEACEAAIKYCLANLIVK